MGGLRGRQGDDTVDRLVLAGQLRRGIEHGELVVSTSPSWRCAAARRRRRGARALGAPDARAHRARRLHPARRADRPDRAVTHDVLDRAAQCGAWQAAGLELGLGQHLAPQPADAHLTGLMNRPRRWVAARRLQLEITESRAVRPAAREGAARGAPRPGCRVAIDDFGTGFSSLAQLQRLPIDEIKIDRSFVIDMESNPRNAAIVRATIELARELGLAVTAEGVETAAPTRSSGGWGATTRRATRSPPAASRPLRPGPPRGVVRARARVPDRDRGSRT